jgi:hypothetical protein
MTPTKAQLADPTWWDENAPGSATHARSIEAGVDFYKRENDLWLYFDKHNTWARAHATHEGCCVPRPVRTNWAGPQYGLPPVGTECLVVSPGFSHPRFDRFIGQTVFVVAHDVVDDTQVAVFRMPLGGDSSEQDYHALVADMFRPVETPTQKAERQRAEVVQAMVDRFAIYDIPNVPWSDLFAQMYDAGVLVAPNTQTEN